MLNIDVKKTENGFSLNFEHANYLWFMEYIDGYFKATCEMLNKIDNKANRTLIYPTLFSFSQYLELWLKLLTLTANDSSSVKEFKLNVHSVKELIKNITEKHGELLRKYNVDFDLLYQLESKYLYFDEFVTNGKYLSMSSRFPLDDKTENIIINFDKIDKIEKDNYITFKNNIFDILKITEEITKQFFIKWFSNCFDKVDLNSLQ